MKVGKRFQPRILTISANIIQFPNSTTNIFDLTFYFHSISTFEPVQSIFGQKMWFLPSRFFFLPHVIFLNLEETLFSFNSKQFFHVRRENFLGNLEIRSKKQKCSSFRPACISFKRRRNVSISCQKCDSRFLDYFRHTQ